MGQPITRGTNLSRPRRVKVFAEAPREEDAYISDNPALQDSLNTFQDKKNKLLLEQQSIENLYYNEPIDKPLFRTSMPSRERIIIKNKLNDVLNRTAEEINNYYDFIYRNKNELTPVGARDSTFIKEAQDLADFYKRTSPETEVDIIPFYGDEDRQRIEQEFASLGEEDLPVLMGHSGNKIGGIPNTDLAEMYKGCSARDLLIGSCEFNSRSLPFRETGKNVTMRPNTSWYGVNPYGKTLMDAMYGVISEDSIAPTPTYKKDYLRFRGNQILGE